MTFRILQSEYSLSLVVANRVCARALLTGWGTWHISRGRRRVGAGHPRAKQAYGLACLRSPYQPDRCVWTTTATRREAVDQLYDMGNRMAFGRTA